MNLDEMKGEWALVTGASAGIGHAYATELARRGLNVVLVARRQERLEALAMELSGMFATRSVIVSEDLGVPGAAGRIAGQVSAKGIQLRLLVNNAAVGHWGRFEDVGQEAYRSMLQTNIVALVELTRAFLPDLAARTPSAVVNVASGAAYQPVPFMAAYAASKAFVLSFSQALYGEWVARGVLVQALVPGPTKTEFDQLAGAYSSAIKGRGAATKVVQDSIAALAQGGPIAMNAKGTFKQRFFVALFSPKFVIRQVGKMFRPPTDLRP